MTAGKYLLHIKSVPPVTSDSSQKSLFYRRAKKKKIENINFREMSGLGPT